MFVRLGIYELLFMWVILAFPIFEIIFEKNVKFVCVNLFKNNKLISWKHNIL